MPRLTRRPAFHHSATDSRSWCSTSVFPSVIPCVLWRFLKNLHVASAGIVSISRVGSVLTRWKSPKLVRLAPSKLIAVCRVRQSRRCHRAPPPPTTPRANQNHGQVVTLEQGGFIDGRHPVSEGCQGTLRKMGSLVLGGWRRKQVGLRRARLVSGLLGTGKAAIRIGYALLLGAGMRLSLLPPSGMVPAIGPESTPRRRWELDITDRH